MRVRRQRPGKFSQRFEPQDASTAKPAEEQKDACRKCTYFHEPSARCPADSRECNSCGKEGHFARSSLCKSDKKGKQRYSTTRRVDDESTASEGDEDITRITTWPGVRKGTTRHDDVKFVEDTIKSNKRKSKQVDMEMCGTQVSLYCDTGSRLTGAASGKF